MRKTECTLQEPFKNVLLTHEKLSLPLTLITPASFAVNSFNIPAKKTNKIELINDYTEWILMQFEIRIAKL